MAARQIFEGRRRYIFRLPKEAAGGAMGNSGWGILSKAKHRFDGAGNITPSVLYAGKKWGGRRHFFVKGGQAHFCEDDAICPGAICDLEFVNRFWVEGIIDLLCPTLQRGEVGLAGEDY